MKKPDGEYTVPERIAAVTAILKRIDSAGAACSYTGEDDSGYIRDTRAYAVDKGGIGDFTCNAEIGLSESRTGDLDALDDHMRALTYWAIEASGHDGYEIDGGGSGSLLVFAYGRMRLDHEEKFVSYTAYESTYDPATGNMEPPK